MRIGLVLGAGGVMGGAWLTGGLEALARETGWDPGSADRDVGTSAGSMIGALNAAGVPPWFMVAHQAGEVFEGVRGPDGRPAEDADRNAGAEYSRVGTPLPLPGSWRLALGSLRDPRRHTPGQVATGWLPRGTISTEPLRDTIRRAVPRGWAAHPGLWVVACDYASGRRVAFGRQGTPTAELADAVAASCAIPAFYEPVEIAGRDYVDGGIYSPSNLDLLRDEELDLVICLNPTSSLHPVTAWNPLERFAGVFREGSGRRLGSEARKLRAAGTRVVLIQPLREDHEAMGPNLMSRRSVEPVIQTAIRTVSAQLRKPAIRSLLEGLPPGEPYLVRRPSTPPSQWPSITEAARLRERTRAASRAA